jgi:aminoglycoside 6'-N-acetyltransferase I
MTSSDGVPEPLLRAASVDDLPDLLRLAREFYDEDGFATSDADLERNFRALLASPADAYVCLAVVDGTCVGFALTTSRMILESGIVAELQDLYVMPAHRRHGVGDALVDDAVEWAADHNASLIEVVVAPNGRDVSRLIAYYERLGFSDEGRLTLGLEL